MSKRTDKALDATAAHVKALAKILDAHTAEYIVRAVKSYKDLLKACRGALEAATVKVSSMHIRSKQKEIIDQLEAALAKATG